MASYKLDDFKLNVHQYIRMNDDFKQHQPEITKKLGKSPRWSLSLKTSTNSGAVLSCIKCGISSVVNTISHDVAKLLQTVHNTTF